MSHDQLVQQFTDRLKFSDFRSSVLFDMGDDGMAFVDASQTPPTIENQERDADLRVIASRDLLEGFLNGTKDPNIAFMTGKLKVKGSIGLAMKLNALFED